jgi:hypothetical protein
MRPLGASSIVDCYDRPALPTVTRDVSQINPGTHCHKSRPYLVFSASPAVGIFRGDIMSINISNDNNIPPEVYYQKQASQEELYLEETEQEVRAILTSDDQGSSRTTAEYWQSKIEELELDWE